MVQERFCMNEDSVIDHSHSVKCWASGWLLHHFTYSVFSVHTKSVLKPHAPIWRVFKTDSVLSQFKKMYLVEDRLDPKLSHVRPTGKWAKLLTAVVQSTWYPTLCMYNNFPNFGTFRDQSCWQKHFVWRKLKQGPLNIWTEHSNCQIHIRGDSKTLIASLIPKIFLIFFMKLFFMSL